MLYYVVSCKYSLYGTYEEFRPRSTDRGYSMGRDYELLYFFTILTNFNCISIIFLLIFTYFYFFFVFLAVGFAFVTFLCEADAVKAVEGTYALRVRTYMAYMVSNSATCCRDHNYRPNSLTF